METEILPVHYETILCLVSITLFIILLIFFKKYKRSKIALAIISFILLFDVINTYILFDDMRSIAEKGYFKSKNYHYAIEVESISPMPRRPEILQAEIYVQLYFGVKTYNGFGYGNIYFSNPIEKLYTKYHYGPQIIYD